MGYEAVVFDLFGTLVDELKEDVFRRVLKDTADALGVRFEDFGREWGASSIERQTGRLGDITENLSEVCRRAGVVPSEDGLQRALAIRREMFGGGLVPKRGAEATLRQVKSLGLSTALVSMCGPDTPEMWNASPLARWIDVIVFSSETGLRKPDPEIYLLACEGLGVNPPACLYVGDGAYGELTGAAAVGMSPVLIRDPDEPDGRVVRPEAERWAGPRVSTLTELLDLL
jgi:putative hydrolase of the HAD superfamily